MAVWSKPTHGGQWKSERASASGVNFNIAEAECDFDIKMSSSLSWMSKMSPVTPYNDL